MKTIIIPTDFSKASIDAFRYAIEMFKGEDVKFILLNAYLPPSSGTDILISLEDMMRKDSLRELEVIHSDLLSEYSTYNLDVILLPVNGTLVNVIEDVYTEYDVELIVMGTHGATGLKKFFVGSNAHQVVHDLNLPILLIPDEAMFSGVDNIVLSYHGAEYDVDVKALKQIKNLNNASVTRLTLLKKKDLEPSLERNYIQGDVLRISDKDEEYLKEDVAEGLTEFIDQSGATMLAMCPRRMNNLRSFFKNSMTNKFIFNKRIPLLILPRK